MIVRVIICDDQAVVREGLELILNADSEIDVIGLAEDGHIAVEMAMDLKPDIVLMDLKMPGLNGIKATQLITKELPDTKVLVLTTFGEDEWVFDAVRSGASGYLLKGTPRQELIKAVKGSFKGESYIDPLVGAKILEKLAKPEDEKPSNFSIDLSDREVEVLRLIARGFSNAQIAKRLHLSVGTIRNYVSNLLSKLEVNDRTQAAVLAIKYGIN